MFIRKQTVFDGKPLISYYWRGQRRLVLMDKCVAIETHVNGQTIRVLLEHASWNPFKWWWKVGIYYINFRYTLRMVQEWRKLVRSAQTSSVKNDQK